MPAPLKDFVHQVLLERSRAGRLHAAVHKAWQQTLEGYPQRSRWQRKSTFRNLVWEAAISELSALSFEDSDFKVVTHRDTASFIVEDSVLIRFKHADVALATANYPTAEARNFDDHDKDLYGYTGLQRVELVYVLNEFETEVVWVGIAARSAGELLWKLELTGEGVRPVTEELPLTEPESDTSRLATLRRPVEKDAEKKKKKDNG